MPSATEPPQIGVVSNSKAAGRETTQQNERLPTSNYGTTVIFGNSVLALPSLSVARIISI